MWKSNKLTFLLYIIYSKQYLLLTSKKAKKNLIMRLIEKIRKKLIEKLKKKI